MKNIISIWKKFVLSIIICVFVFFTTGCFFLIPLDRSYQEDNPELLSATMYSMLDISGYVNESHGYVPVDIKVLEEDGYGRKLFGYCEDQYGTRISLLVIQKHDDIYSYYYPDYNFISKNGSSDLEGRQAMFHYGYTFSDALMVFTDDDKKLLKERNDWNKPIDENMCVKVEIAREKTEPDIWYRYHGIMLFEFGRDELIKAFEPFCQTIAAESGCKGTDSVFRSATYCTSDEYGRVLYYAYGIHRDVKGEGISPTSEAMYFDIAFIFYPDGSNGSAVRLKDIYDYQDDLKTFKESNNWGKPLMVSE